MSLLIVICNATRSGLGTSTGVTVRRRAYGFCWAAATASAGAFCTIV